MGKFVPDQPTSRFVPDAPAEQPQQPPKAQGFWPKFNEASRTMVGAGENVAQFASGVVATPIAESLATIAEAREEGRGAPMASAVANRLTFQPRSEMGKTIAEHVVQPAMEPVAGFVDWGAKGFPRSPEEQTGTPVGEHAIKAGLGFLGLKGIGGRRPAPRAAPEPAPTIPELRAQSQAAYKAAENTGAISTSDALGNVANDVEKMLTEEGYRPALHPATADALSAIMEDATRPGVVGQTMKGVEGLRRVVANAERAAANADDARLAGQMLDKLDDHIDTLAPQFKEGRALWARMRKGQDIEALFERAENAAGGYTQSGFENALRLQFKRLADNPKRFSRYTPEEQAAILQTVRGGNMQKLARWAGKLAPRGVVSAAAGFILGGGPTGALALGALGESARAIGTGMRESSARAVSDLVRRGPQAPQAGQTMVPELPAPLAIAPALALSAGRQRPGIDLNHIRHRAPEQR